MANFNKYFDTLMAHEGGYSDRKADRGGPTKWGMTLATWLAHGYDKNRDGRINVEDLKITTKEDAYKVAKNIYWNPVKGDEILSQSVAEFLFDFGYNSGTGTAVRKLQQILKVKADGIMGPTTLRMTNLQDAQKLFEQLKASRMSFVQAIVRSDKSQKANLNGWVNRINSFKFKS